MRRRLRSRNTFVWDDVVERAWAERRALHRHLRSPLRRGAADGRLPPASSRIVKANPDRVAGIRGA